MLKNVLGTGLLLVAGFVGYSVYGNSNSGDQKVSSATVTTVSVKTSTPTAFQDVVTTDVSINRIESNAKNVVLLDTEVFGESVDAVIDQLEKLRKSGTKKAYLVITSPGGSVVAGAKLISYIDASPMEVDTVCEVICASMGAHIHQAGKTRYMVDRSILMFHPASGGTEGTIEQMLSQITMYKLLVDRLDANAASRAGVDFDKFKSMVVSELWMDSRTSLEGHFTDALAYVFWGKTRGDAFSARKAMKERNITTPKFVKDAIPLSVRNVWANTLLP